jgi:hypothetical protein
VRPDAEGPRRTSASHGYPSLLDVYLRGSALSQLDVSVSRSKHLRNIQCLQSSPIALQRGMLHRAVSLFGLAGDLLLGQNVSEDHVENVWFCVSQTPLANRLGPSLTLGTLSIFADSLSAPRIFLRAIGPSLPRRSRLTILTSSDLSGRTVFRVVVRVSLSQCHPRRPAPALRQGSYCGACLTFCRLWRFRSSCLEVGAQMRSQPRSSVPAVVGRWLA